MASNSGRLSRRSVSASGSEMAVACITRTSSAIDVVPSRMPHGGAKPCCIMLPRERHLRWGSRGLPTWWCCCMALALHHVVRRHMPSLRLNSIVDDQYSNNHRGGSRVGSGTSIDMEVSDMKPNRHRTMGNISDNPTEKKATTRRMSDGKTEWLGRMSDGKTEWLCSPT